MDERDKARTEFSVREGWGGKIVLRVLDFSSYPATGEWRDASPRDLPLFFERLLKGKANGQSK